MPPNSVKTLWCPSFITKIWHHSNQTHAVSTEPHIIRNNIKFQETF